MTKAYKEFLSIREKWEFVPWRLRERPAGQPERLSAISMIVGEQNGA
jgi:hypothetical protein